jgi:hypothetical protein
MSSGMGAVKSSPELLLVLTPDRDANETDCEKLKRTISGYCDPAKIFTKAVACPKA